ncbi:S-layer homology domain-containing protein [Cohnella soli]|uniref:S-layer homology domain-containing protein n=1 Tax=Cohnella soli TaxID=425005 RepID=A0ABW0HVW7_9BACL
MSKSKFLTKTLSMIVLLAVVFGVMNVAWAASSEKKAKDDMQGHWAEIALRKWVSEGLLKGYRNQYSPDQPITRAELITLINRSNNLTEVSDISYSDLARTYWAYNQIAIAAKAGYVKGYADGTIRPGNPVTREEAASMIASYLGLSSIDLKGLSSFRDSGALSSWSKSAVAALAEAGIASGNATGNFLPKNLLSRAEAVTLLDKARSYHQPATEYSQAGVYGPQTGTETIRGDVIVSAPGVTLRNLIIEGDLTLTAGVGEGDATFKKVTVKGTTIVRGGGANSIHFEDSVLVRISIDKTDGTVRVVVVGATSVENVVVHTPVKLEESSVTDSGFKNVELADNLPAGSNVQLTGQFENVRVLSSDIRISLPKGSVGQLDVGNDASNNQIEVGREATIAELVLNAVAKLLGQGTIDKATVNNGAAGSSFEKRPTNVDGSASGSIGAFGGSSYNGNSGGSGGNNGGDNICILSPDDCRDATLKSLAVSDFTLNQLDASFMNTGGTGFTPSVFAYSIVTPREMAEPVTTTISVTHATYATVSYTIFGPGRTLIASGVLTKDNPSFQVSVRPLQDVSVYINVKSKDGKSTKMYRVEFQYPRTIQEGLRIGTFAGRISQYALYKGSVNGQRLGETDTVKLFEPGSSEPFVTCKFTICVIPEGKVTNTVGTWDVQIMKNDIVFAEGQYHYDFSIVNVVSNNGAIEVVPYTTQELIEALVNYPGTIRPYQFGYTVFVKKDRLLQDFPNAKYITTGTIPMNSQVTVLPEGLPKEDYKLDIMPASYVFYVMGPAKTIYYDNMENSQEIGGFTYPVFDDPNVPKLVNDMYNFVGVYDEDFHLLGQMITPVTFDEAHVASGYIPARNWQPVLP